MLDVDSIRYEKKLPEDFHKRRGWFRVSSVLIDLPTADIMKFMSNFLIVRAEFLHTYQCIEYYAVSELFEPVEDGYETPEYKFSITKFENGSLEVKASKVYPEQGKKLLRLLRKLDV